MAAYDFHRLSPYDFEELVRDLLQAEWGVRFESFTVGRDSGIDLRCLRGPDGAVIVQCKHTQSATYAQLLRNLRQLELPKVKLLKPSRYLVVTSIGLTPDNKNEISSLFAPYVHSPDDVLGREDVDNLLRRHPSVETSNFKLWLTSTAVMQRVLHNAEHCQTEFEVDRVIRKLPVFVQSDAFPRAQNILADTHTVVISGVPGIGKTTLADMLLYAHLEQGFEPVIVQGGIAEAKRLFDKSKSQIFYFDDFLGATFFQGRSELIDRNQDASLIAFIEAIGKSQSTRFVLTTREHVLRSALNISERLAHSKILTHRCLLHLEDYSYSQKARILYNHLYFSDLPQGYKEAVLSGEFYLRIIKHRNFIPRVIEWLSGYVRMRQVRPDQYREHVTGLLESPEAIWSYAFEHQISPAARTVLLSMASSRSGIDVIDLEPLWASLHQHCSRKYNFSTSPNDFKRALDELEGSFIQIRDNRVEFANASVHDFVDNILRGSAEHTNDLLASAIRFVQLKHLFDLAAERSSAVLSAAVLEEPEPFLASLERVLYGPHLRWTKRLDGSVGTFLDTYPETRLQSLVEWAENRRSRALLDLINKLAEYLLSNWGSKLSLDINSAVSVLEAIDAAPWVQANGGTELKQRIIETIVADLYLARYYEWDNVLEYYEKTQPWRAAEEKALDAAIRKYKENGIDEEARDCSSTGELEELRDGLIALQKQRGLALEYAISRVESRMEYQEERFSDHSSYTSRNFSDGWKPKAPANDEEIRNLFRTLID